MSLRTDILDSLPDRITDPTLVHNLKDITNNYANDIRNLTNNTLFTQDSVLDENTDWDKLPVESYGLVLNWKGNHAPKLRGAGIVFVIGSGVENMAQIAIGRTGIAVRNSTADWSIISNHTHLSHARLYNDVQKVLNEFGLDTLTKTVNSLVDTTGSYASNLHSIYQNQANLDSENTSNAGKISQLNTVVSSDTSEASGMYSNINSYVSSINNDVSSETSAINDRETHTEANDTYKHVEDLLAQKWSFIDGNLQYSDLNLDTQKGAWRIEAQPLQNAPSKYYNNFTDGLLQVQPVGDNNLFQMLYFTIGNADDTDDQSKNVDGNGVLCYRSGHIINGNVNWLEWNTVPYQRDLDSLKNKENKDYTYLSSLGNTNTNSLANQANGLYSTESETRSESAVSLASKGVSLYYDALHSADSYYQADSAQTDKDYNNLQNKIVSGESEIANEAAQSAEAQASQLANSIAASEAANGGKVSTMTNQIDNLIGNVNTYRNEIDDNNNTILQTINNAKEVASKSASSAAQVATNDSASLNGSINDLSQGINGKFSQQNDSISGTLSTFKGNVSNAVNTSINAVNHTINTDSGQLSHKELTDVQFIEDYLGLDPSKNPHPQPLNTHGNDSDVSSLMSAVYGNNGVDSISSNTNAINNMASSLTNQSSFATVSTEASDNSQWISNNSESVSDTDGWVEVNSEKMNTFADWVDNGSAAIDNDDEWIADNSSEVSSALSVTAGVPDGTTLQQEIYQNNDNLPDMSSYVTQSELNNDSYATKDEIPSNYLPIIKGHRDLFSQINSWTIDVNYLQGYSSPNLFPYDNKRNPLSGSVNIALPSGIYFTRHSNDDINLMDIPSLMQDDGVKETDNIEIIVGNNSTFGILIDSTTQTAYSYDSGKEFMPSMFLDVTTGNASAWGKLNISPMDLKNYVTKDSLDNYATINELSSLANSTVSYHSTAMKNVIDVNLNTFELETNGGSNPTEDIPSGIYLSSPVEQGQSQLPFQVNTSDDPTIGSTGLEGVSTHDDMMLIVGTKTSSDGILVDISKGSIYVHNRSSDTQHQDNWWKIASSSNKDLSATRTLGATPPVDTKNLEKNITKKVTSSVVSDVKNSLIPSLANSIKASLSHKSSN